MGSFGDPVHELSVCQALLEQVNQLAQLHGAVKVTRIVLHIGPLSGVDAGLLMDAFTIARSGTVATEAFLVIEAPPIRIFCRECGHESAAYLQCLFCPQCNSLQTTVINGDELLLATMEMEVE